MIAALALIVALSGAVGTPLYSGNANYAAPSHGDQYLAMRLPRGTIVEICGAGTCHRMRVNDFGPVASTGDIADISLYWFSRICGYSIEEAKLRGECPVVVEEFGRVALPATDTLPVLRFGR